MHKQAFGSFKSVTSNEIATLRFSVGNFGASVSMLLHDDGDWSKDDHQRGEDNDRNVENSLTFSFSDES